MKDYKKLYENALDWVRKVYPTLEGADKEDAEHYFPELRESEDERIRKMLIERVRTATELTVELRDSLLIYLEKQKEQVMDESNKIAAAYQLGRSDERKEQKPLPSSEDCDGIPGKDYIPVEWFDACERYGKWKIVEQEPAEWSEEDEKLMYYVYEAVQVRYSDMQLGKYLDPKIINEKRELGRKIFDFLRNLRPSWKPSKEQMEAFRKYIEDFQARAEAAVGGWNNFDVMIRLYEQLKKL